MWKASSKSLLRNASSISSSSMPARRWRSSRQPAATSLFWGADTSAQRATEHLQAARGRVAQLGEWFGHMEGRQAALREQIQPHNDMIDALERALFEVQDEEEQLSYEWEIEREIDEKPRKLSCPGSTAARTTSASASPLRWRC